MIITLYLEDKILNFKLPTYISGSYTFDFEEDEGSLINIDGIDNKWILYQTEDSKIVENGQFVEKVQLISNRFYTLQKNDKVYLIFVYDTTQTNMLAYNYNQESKLIIGQSNAANIVYKCSLLKDAMITISFKDQDIIINNPNNVHLYVNKYNIDSNKLSYGDTLEIFGLRILFLSSMILINNLNDRLTINATNANITNMYFENDEPPKNIEVKNIDLYSKNDYFSKSPRLRRTIEHKKIKLTAPPREGENQELPLILTIGPMATMGITSLTMLMSVLIRISNKETTFSNSWPQLVTSLVMATSMILWPLLIRKYNKKQKEKRKQEIITKYNEYLDVKRKDLLEESKLQNVILHENLITIEDCINNLNRKKINFWDKRIDQSDFLTVRLGTGSEKLDADIEYPEEDFTIEESKLRESADKLVDEFKYISNVPIGYSFFENSVTNISGQVRDVTNYINNILLQLLTFYSYEDLKIVIFTEEGREKNWEYLKYLNHNFSNMKDFRLFSSNAEDAKILSDYLNYELQNRTQTDFKYYKPHYLLIVDGCDSLNNNNILKNISEIDEQLGFSAIILENRMNKLPSKCNRFIMLNGENSTILINNFDEQKNIKFVPEIHYDLNMRKLTKDLANIPIEFSDNLYQMPESISFLEMEKVGKVEQLNILNRWNMNDSTQSLKAEIGVDQNGEMLYLDLHEKAHGPHGLIAGTTGSGKSELIISYIISMAMNYSPDDVSFILIDYKGGGLAFAFENKNTGFRLPHLAGTITNLDKAEIVRTLVSINSEVNRRQEKFNEARDILNENTMDIYKYQKYYKEGKLTEPIPHLFIICDEFAELKQQQAEFMDNLISVARIGRSLGVHLILATQKPSGVVNEQIWSNSRFKICLKVQDEQDSKEMLKKSDAAKLKQPGRFYFQVGMDEIYMLGQSAWAGAKYFPSDKVIKQVDKSIDFINNCGLIIKSIQATNDSKIASNGEQLTAILNNIVSVSQMVNKQTNKLWLDNIPNIILIDEIEKKYQFQPDKTIYNLVIGEYDAPEKQEQGAVEYSYLNDGNTLVYSTNTSETEMLIETLLYSGSKNYNSSDVNYYIIDYGSESFRKYANLPHVGGIVTSNDDEEYNNLLKMLKDELTVRKNLFANYGGQYKNYIKNSGKSLPIKVIIINNYDALASAHSDIFDILPDLVRDSQRYGIIYWITATNVSSISRKITSSFDNTYAFKLKDNLDYNVLFDKKLDTPVIDTIGRGVLKHDKLHLFQVASIVGESLNQDDFIASFIQQRMNEVQKSANKIPVLPKIVGLDNVRNHIVDYKRIPIAISKKDLEVCEYDFTSSIGNIISANKLANTKIFVESLITTFSYFKNLFLVVIDAAELLEDIKQTVVNYYNDNFDVVLNSLNKLLEKYKNENSNVKGIILIEGFGKFMNKIKNKEDFTKLLELLKAYEKINLVIVDIPSQVKAYSFESWFSSSFSLTEGIWIGKGVSDQGLFRLGTVNKEMTLNYKDDMGYIINEGSATLCKYIDFFTKE